MRKLDTGYNIFFFSAFSDPDSIYDESGIVSTNEGNITNNQVANRLSHINTNTTCCLRTRSQKQTISFNFLQGKMCCSDEDCQQTITLTDASGEVRNWNAPLQFNDNNITSNTIGNTVLYFEQKLVTIRYLFQLPLYVVHFESK